jgi:hypothetical protein
MVGEASGSLYDADGPAFLKIDLVGFGIDRYW